ncbi:MAG: sensor histidine kinase [Crocinitomicaceae bacterium]|nr:sensor histidine kinase [Crocinitomicaceae bacterium]
MIQKIKQFWNFISYLGLPKGFDSELVSVKNEIFFNRCLTIGFFALLGTIVSSIDFIGNYAFLNLISAAGVLMGLIIHHYGKYQIAKRVAVYPMIVMGLILTAICGADFLYHTGVLTVLIFCWVIFNPKKELPELILFVLVTFAAYIIAELNVFDAEDFSMHPATLASRITNLIMFTSVTVIFINFMRSLNKVSESKLSTSIEEKEVVLKELLIKTEELKNERKVLEETVTVRTSEIESQRDVLKKENIQKEILLKEVHHRVKNNLQIIISLLNLQRGKFKEKAMDLAIEDMQNRLIAMSLVHQRMYQTSNFVDVQMKDYIDLLSEKFRDLVVLEDTSVTCVNKVPEDLSLDVDKAIPIGLIVNELINNSFKHAFVTKGQKCEIHIKIELLDDARMRFTYRDNGQGLPPNFKIEETDSLGMELVSALVQQIDGNLKYGNDNGALFEFDFN